MLFWIPSNVNGLSKSLELYAARRGLPSRDLHFIRALHVSVFGPIDQYILIITDLRLTYISITPLVHTKAIHGL